MFDTAVTVEKNCGDRDMQGECIQVGVGICFTSRNVMAVGVENCLAGGV